MQNDSYKILGNSLGESKNIPRYIVIHCSDVSYRDIKDQFNSINAYHRDERGFPKSVLNDWIGYHYLYTGEKEYKCKEEWEVGAHCNQGFDGNKVYPPATLNKLSMNYQSIGLCLGFDGDIEQPPIIELGLMQKRIWDIQDRYGIKDHEVYFHRYFTGPSKTCPGSLIDNEWLAGLLLRPQPPVILPKPKENMCVAQEKEIAELKERLSWFDKLLSLFFRKI